MVVRLSEKTATGYLYYDSPVMELVKKYNVGGVCLFQEARYYRPERSTNCRQLQKHPS